MITDDDGGDFPFRNSKAFCRLPAALKRLSRREIRRFFRKLRENRLNIRDNSSPQSLSPIRPSQPAAGLWHLRSPSRMARDESDREDLLAEATALVRRAEWHVPELAGPVLLGERDNGWFSMYLGQDQYYQFDAENRLRRAYVAPVLYRTQGVTLARMIRDRTNDATVLRRIDLSEVELAVFRSELRQTLLDVSQALQQPGICPSRFAPEETPEVAVELVGRLRRLRPFDRTDWLAPVIRGKR